MRAPPTARDASRVTAWSPVLAVGVIAAWMTSLVVLLDTPVRTLGMPWAPVLLLGRTWLHTGLFITAHDAMHGVAWPGHPRANRLLGSIAVGLYAMFPFATLRTEHLRHHAAPASTHDPDWHDGTHPGFVRWYLRFVRHYVRWGQIVGMALVFNILQHLAHIPQSRLLVFWVAPALLSTVQLFYFGTYLPHREPSGGFIDAHRARSTDLPGMASLLTCFHFGYHWEHHEHPGVPWWQLPRMRATTIGHPPRTPRLTRRGEGR